MPTDNVIGIRAADPLANILTFATDAKRLGVRTLVLVAMLGDGGCRAVEVARLDELDAVIQALQALRAGEAAEASA